MVMSELLVEPHNERTPQILTNAKRQRRWNGRGDSHSQGSLGGASRRRSQRDVNVASDAAHLQQFRRLLRRDKSMRLERFDTFIPNEDLELSISRKLAEFYKNHVGCGTVVEKFQG